MNAEGVINFLNLKYGQILFRSSWKYRSCLVHFVVTLDFKSDNLKRSPDMSVAKKVILYYSNENEGALWSYNHLVQALIKVTWIFHLKQAAQT